MPIYTLESLAFAICWEHPFLGNFRAPGAHGSKVANKIPPSSFSPTHFLSSSVNSAWSPSLYSPLYAVTKLPSGFTRTAPTQGLTFPSSLLS